MERVDPEKLEEWKQDVNAPYWSQRSRVATQSDVDDELATFAASKG